MSALIAFGTVSRIQAERFARERDKARELAQFSSRSFVSADPAEPGTIWPRASCSAFEVYASGCGRHRRAVGAADFLSILGRTYQRLANMKSQATARPGACGRLGCFRIGTTRSFGVIDRARRNPPSGRRVRHRGGGSPGCARAHRALGAAHARALGGLARTLAQAGRSGRGGAELLDLRPTSPRGLHRRSTRACWRTGSTIPARPLFRLGRLRPGG